jgi:hypothetical protein
MFPNSRCNRILPCARFVPPFSFNSRREFILVPPKKEIIVAKQSMKV